MTAPIDLTAARAKKQSEDVCLYCGEPPHKTQLACPRIAHLTIEDGAISGISFWGDFYDDEDPDFDPAA